MRRKWTYRSIFWLTTIRVGVSCRHSADITTYLWAVQNPTESAQHFRIPFSLSTNIRRQEGEFTPMGSYLVSLQSAFVPSVFLTSRLSRPSRKSSAAAIVALSKPGQPSRSTSPFGLVGLRLGFPSHNTPIIVTTGIAVPVEHKERLMRE